MALSLISGATAKRERPPKAPFRARFKAWWDGTEAPEAMSESTPAGEVVAEAPWSSGEREQVDSPAWTSARIAAVQFLWGKGYWAPGDSEYTIKQLKPLGLNKDMSMLDLSAGLGGPGRDVVDSFGIWITGKEPDAALADAGMELSTMAGMSRKMPIEPYDAESVALGEGRYQVIVANTLFSIVQDKARLLREIAASAKPGGQISFTDHVLGDGDDEAFLEAWAAGEPVTPSLWSVKQYRAAFDENELDCRISQDITDEHLELIISGWWRAQKAVRRLKDSGKASEEVLNAIAAEAELWAQRSAALQRGCIRYFRFHLMKPRPLH